MRCYFFFLFVSFSSITFCQFPAEVNALDVKPNTTFEVKGNLTEGEVIADLTWASRSSTACFPATQNSKFRGNHVLYGFKLPSYGKVKITVIPDNKNADFSIYGYQVGSTNYPVVPNLSSCVSCEAQHKWDRPKRGQTQDHTRSISFNSIRNPYNIFIGVTGNNGLKKGGYTLKIELEAAIENTSEQEPLKIYTAESKKGMILSYKGNLNEGVKLNSLAWASRSSTACFPATQNSKFRGNHVIFTTTIPPRSIMKITVIPVDKKQDLSIYGYQVGLNNNQMVPELSSVIACEADHKWDRPKRGRTQDHTRSISFNSISNSYKIVIGVTGPAEAVNGEFIIKIDVE